MILSFCLCLFSFSLQLPLFLSSYPLGTELLTACLNDTVPTSLSPSTVYVPCSSSCLCLISPNVIMEREKRSFLVNILPRSLIIFLSCLLWLKLFTHFSAWPLLSYTPPHLLWFTILRLGCRCHFTSWGCFIVLESLSL